MQGPNAAREVIEDITTRGLRPVLVGGSGLYVRAALDELEFPPTDAVVRARFEELARRVGLDGMRERLREVDPVSAERLGDVRRVVRALEESRYAENTIIVLWGDHGWHLGEKQHWGKWTGWERSTRVPLIFAGPGIAVDARSKPRDRSAE